MWPGDGFGSNFNAIGSNKTDRCKTTSFSPLLRFLYQFLTYFIFLSKGGARGRPGGGAYAPPSSMSAPTAPRWVQNSMSSGRINWLLSFGSIGLGRVVTTFSLCKSDSVNWFFRVWVDFWLKFHSCRSGLGESDFSKKKIQIPLDRNLYFIHKWLFKCFLFNITDKTYLAVIIMCFFFYIYIQSWTNFYWLWIYGLLGLKYFVSD